MSCVVVRALVKGLQCYTIFISVLTVVDLCMIVFMTFVFVFVFVFVLCFFMIVRLMCLYMPDVQIFLN